MKIEGYGKAKNLYHLKPGDCFMYEGEFYLLTTVRKDNRYTAVNIEDGMIRVFIENDEITPVSIKAVIE